MAQSGQSPDNLLSDSEDVASGTVSPVSPVSADDTTADMETLKVEQELQLKQLSSREASLRINEDNGEPPPIDKKTLLGLITVYFSVFLDMMGISIVQPVLPFYAEKFGANSLELGALYSSYSLMATFASYAMGKASDKVSFLFLSFFFCLLLLFAFLWFGCFGSVATFALCFCCLKTVFAIN